MKLKYEKLQYTLVPVDNILCEHVSAVRVRISPPKSSRYLIPVESKNTIMYLGDGLFLQARIQNVKSEITYFSVQFVQ